ncbi:MAG: hypothetical protein U1A78_16150 [Polyangia bacterium]
MRKLVVALLGLGACYAWPTIPNPDHPADGGGDGGGTSVSSCPSGGTLVNSGAELQKVLASALASDPVSELVFCLSPGASPYTFSEPLAAKTSTLGNVLLPPITAAVMIIGLGSKPADTELAASNANTPTLNFANLRCPASSGRFFYVKPTGHLKLVNLELNGGCVQGGRGGLGTGGGGGGGGGAGLGGAVLVEGGKLTLDRVSFRNNLALGGLGGGSRATTNGIAGGGGGGGGLDPSGSISDGAQAPDPIAGMTLMSGGSGGGSTGGSGSTAQGGAGQGSGGGGGGGGTTSMTNTAAAKGSNGGIGAPLAGGGGGGGAINSGGMGNATGGTGGAPGFCGGGGGGGGAGGLNAVSTIGSGGNPEYSMFLGTPGRSYACGDTGEMATGGVGGAGGSGWGLGGAIAFLGGELTVVQLAPALQVNNQALTPDRGSARRDGTGAFLFAIGTDSGAFKPFKTTSAPTDVPGVVIVNCTSQSGCL